MPNYLLRVVVHRRRRTSYHAPTTVDRWKMSMPSSVIYLNFPSVYFSSIHLRWDIVSFINSLLKNWMLHWSLSPFPKSRARWWNCCQWRRSSSFDFRLVLCRMERWGSITSSSNTMNKLFISPFSIGRTVTIWFGKIRSNYRDLCHCSTVILFVCLTSNSRRKGIVSRCFLSFNV